MGRYDIQEIYLGFAVSSDIRYHDMPAPTSAFWTSHLESLGEMMYAVDQHGRPSFERSADEIIKERDCFVLAELKTEPLLDFFDRLITCKLDIWYVGVLHESEQVQNKVRRATQRSESHEAILLKLFEPAVRISVGIDAAKTINHLNAESHAGC